MCQNVWLDGQLWLATLKQLFALLAPVVYKSVHNNITLQEVCGLLNPATRTTQHQNPPMSLE